MRKIVMPVCLLNVAICLAAGTQAWAQSPAAAPAPQPSAVAAQPIDLPATLKLAGANNLDLALVKQSLAQAQAQNLSATISFLPSLSGGLGYLKHNGEIQDVSGNMLVANKQLRSEAGGINAGVNLGDALFQKLSASRLQSAAEYSVDAGRNVTMLNAATAYFDLVTAFAGVKIAEEAVRISRDYGSQLDRAVAIGLANKSDALRVNVQTQAYEVALRQARETARNASARLANILHLDPALEFQPADDVAPQITLVPVESDLKVLIAEAMDRRPEIKASAASVEAANWQKTGSIYGPLIPSVGAQALYSNINGGRLGIPDNSGAAQDYGVMFNWRIGQGGLFDMGRIDYADSKLEQSRIQDAKLRDDIGRQVVQSFEGVRSAFDQLALTKKNVDLAEQSLNLSQSRREFGVAGVLEIIEAQKDLTRARGDYVKALAAYAEFEYALAQAIGRMGQ